MDEAVSSSIPVRLGKARFGAEIVGLDRGDISNGDKALIWQMYKDRRGLICFSFDRLLEAEELHALTAVFDENEFAPRIINGLTSAT